MDKGHVVDTSGSVGKEAADPFTGLTILLPRPRAGHDGAGIGLKEFDFLAGVPFLAGLGNEAGFVVECVALAGGTGHEELDYALGTGGVVCGCLCFFG